MVPFTVPNVIVNNSGKQFGFRRKALLGSLFYLEQQSTAKANGGLLIGGLEGAPNVFHR